MPGVGEKSSRQQVSRTTILKDTVDPEEIPGAVPESQKSWDAWEYMEKQWAKDAATGAEVVLHLYRLQPRPYNGGETKLERILAPITSDYIDQKYGGRDFRLLIKCGVERVADSKYYNELPPKYPHQNLKDDPGATQPAAPADPNASLGMRALEMVGGPQAETFRALLDVFREASKAAIDQVRAQTMNAAPQKSAKEELRETLALIREFNGGIDGGLAKAKSPIETAVESAMTAMVSKMLTPGNPIEDFKSMATAISSVQSLAGGGSANRGSLVSEVVAALPSAIREATGMLREIRMNNEVMARTAPIAPPGPSFAGGRNPSQPNVVTMPAPAAPDSGQGPIEVHPPDPNWIKLRVVQMIAEPDTQPVDVAEWLRDTAPEFLAQLTAATPEQILGYFKSDPVLQHAAGNPRLPQFVRDFVSYLHDVPTTAQAAAPEKPPA